MGQGFQLLLGYIDVGGCHIWNNKQWRSTTVKKQNISS
jgi:hypothetical protein